MKEDPTYTPEQAARLAGVSRPTVLRAIAAGDLVAEWFLTPFGQKWRCIKHADLMAWKARREAAKIKPGPKPKK